MIDDTPDHDKVAILPPAPSAGVVHIDPPRAPRTDHSGRPTISQEKLSEFAQFKITPTDLKTLRDLAMKLRIPMAVLLRDALHLLFARECVDVPPFGLDCRECEVINCFCECPIYSERTKP